MSIPPELVNKIAADEAICALKMNDTKKYGKLITKWQNDLSDFILKRQDMEEILYHCKKLQNELNCHPDKKGCLNLLETLMCDIKEELGLE